VDIGPAERVDTPPKARYGIRPAVALVVCLGMLVVSPAAHAAWPPRWLLGPHHGYTLDYEASRSSDGTAVDSFPEEPRCEYYVVNSQGSSNARVAASYQVVFGGARVRTRTGSHVQFALAWRLVRSSASGQDSATAHGSLPSDCPNYSASAGSIGGPIDAACSDHLEGGAPEVEVTSALPLANPRRFRLELTPETEASRQICSSDNPFAPNQEVWPKHFEPIYPGAGTLAFTKAGILAGKAFQGKIATVNGLRDVVTPEAGQGTDPEGNGEAQSVWSVGISSADDFTLRPAGDRR
jgi:hypothetical protein